MNGLEREIVLGTLKLIEEHDPSVAWVVSIVRRSFGEETWEKWKMQQRDVFDVIPKSIWSVNRRIIVASLDYAPRSEATS